MNQRSVETFLHTSIKDELLPERIGGFEPGVEFIHRLLENCPVAATDPLAQEGFVFGIENPYDTDSNTDIELVQLTRKHGRSFEVCHPAAATVWHDEYGNLYSSINLKGNNFSNPHVMKTPTAPDGYIAYGLQESSVSRRVLRASRLMRENGIGTEYILGMAEPKSFGWPTTDNRTNSLEFLDLIHYKQKLVEQSWMQLSEAAKTAETYVEMARAFEQMTFLVSARAMDTSYRFYDVMHHQQAAKAVFSLINEHLRGPDQPDLNPIDAHDMFEYVTDYVIPAAAKNLAKLHSLGLAHRFPNSLNITGLGSLVDVDSVHGASLELGDDPITLEDIALDLLGLTDGLDDLGVADYLLRTMNDGPKIAERVVKHYLTEIREQFAVSGQSEEAFKTQLLTLTAAIHHQASMQVDSDIILTASQLEKRFMDIYGGMVGQPDVAHADQLVEAWVEKYWEGLSPHLEQKVIDDIPTVLDELFCNYMNECGVTMNFDLIEELTNGKSQAALIARNKLEIEALNSLSFMYMGHISEEPTSEDELAFERDVVEHLITTDYYDWEKYSERVQALVGAVLDKQHAAHVAEAAKPTIPYLFQDRATSGLFITNEGTYVYETTGVSVEDIRQYLETTDAEVTLEPYHSLLASRNTECEITTDGSVLIQVITELPTESSSYTMSPTNPRIELDVSESGYIMFVELKPDGSHRLRIQHPDVDQALSDRSLSRAQIADFLHARKASVQGGLFDIDKYYQPKKPRFDIRLVVNSEMRDYLKI